MGSRAVAELLAGKSNLVICEQGNEIVSIDINLAQTTDRLYKGKDGPEALEKYSKEEQQAILAAGEKKRAYFKTMYALLEEISG